MNKTKKEALERKGWKVGSPGEFLGLTPEEEAYIELKLSLSHFLQEKRKRRRLTQNQLASLIQSSQSRVAKMEKGEESVSIDLILRSLLALGTEIKEIGKSISGIGNLGAPQDNARVERAARGRHGARSRKRPAGTPK
jgi:transcriptional regulator with XRE-family HTH domain